MPIRFDRMMGELQTIAARYHVKTAFPHPDDIHLTLVFMGSISPEQATLVRAGVDMIASGFPPFVIRLGKGGYFGPERSPRILWLGLEISDALDRLQAALAGMVAAAGIPLESRAFSPHVTFARFRARPAPDALTSMIRCINNTTFAEIPVDRVLFMNSQHNGSGPRYTTIQRSDLKGHTSHGQSQDIDRSDRR